MAAQSTATLNVAGSIPPQNKYMCGLLRLVVGCVCDFLFVNAPTEQELFQVWAQIDVKDTTVFSGDLFLVVVSFFNVGQYITGSFLGISVVI